MYDTPLSKNKDKRELDILQRESARNGKITETYMTGLRVMKMIAVKLSFGCQHNKPNGMDWKARFCYTLYTVNIIILCCKEDYLCIQITQKTR